MRIDIVLLITMIILIAFGVTVSELNQNLQDLEVMKTQIEDLANQLREAQTMNENLRNELQAVIQQTEQKDLQIEGLSLALSECQANQATFNLTNDPGASLSEQPMSTDSTNSLSWIISALLTAYTLLPPAMKRLQAAGLIATHPKSKSKYVHLSDEECKMIVKFRRKRG